MEYIKGVDPSKGIRFADRQKVESNSKTQVSFLADLDEISRTQQEKVRKENKKYNESSAKRNLRKKTSEYNFVQDLKMMEDGGELDNIKKEITAEDRARAEKIYRTVAPTGYIDPANYARYATGVERGEDTYIDGRSEEAFRQYLGINDNPNFISESSYTPSISSDKNSRYFKFDENVDATILNMAKDLKVGESRKMSEWDIPHKEDYNILSAMSNFKVSKAKDENGREYVSYYDKYDLPNIVQNEFQGNPFEIYNRVYTDEWEFQDGGGKKDNTLRQINVDVPNKQVRYVKSESDPMYKAYLGYRYLQDISKYVNENAGNFGTLNDKGDYQYSQEQYDKLLEDARVNSSIKNAPEYSDELFDNMIKLAGKEDFYINDPSSKFIAVHATDREIPNTTYINRRDTYLVEDLPFEMRIQPNDIFRNDRGNNTGNWTLDKRSNPFNKTFKLGQQIESNSGYK